MKRTKWIPGVLVTLMLTGCPTHQTKQTKQAKKAKMTHATPRKVQAAPTRASDSAKPPWSVDYSDGSGNAFRFWQESAGAAAQFSYNPVTPEQSSSGTYSGGKPRQGTLKPRQVQELWRRIRRLEGDPSKHAATRKKGSGGFTFKSPDGQGKFLVEASELDQFEELVKPLRGK